MPRDELADALWGEDPPATWDKALTVLVSKLRGLLVEHGFDGAGALTAAFGCYRLDLPEGSWVDVIAAANAAQVAEDALAEGDLEKAKVEATLAASLVRQPFLPGDDGAWVEEKRRELTEVRVRALSVLADACLRSGDAREATTWAEQAIDLAPFRETGYRTLMEAHVAAGNRAEALRVYERCRQLLAEELGTYPSPETEAVYRELLDSPSVHGRAEAGETAPEAGAPPDLEGAVSRTGIDTRNRGRHPHGRGRALAVATAGVVGAAAVVALVLAIRGPPFSLKSGNSGSALAAASAGANAVGAFDQSTGDMVDSAPLGASPSSIAYGQGSVWVTMPNQDAVARIDLRTNAVEQTIGVGNGPSGIAVGDGFVWVANSLAGTVSQIDPRTDGGQVVDTIPVGNRPTGVAYRLGAVWVAVSVDRTVVRIDSQTGKPGTPIQVEAGADAIAVGNGAVWATGESAGVLSRIDPRSGNVTPINVGNGPVAVAAGPGAVWVANSRDATVWRIDPNTNRLKTAVTVGEGPSGLAIADGGRSVWVSNELSGTLSRIDPDRPEDVETVPVGDLPRAVAASRDTTYVALQGSGSAHRGGTLTAAVSAPRGTLAGPLPLSLDPAHGYTAWELLTLTNDGLMGYGRSGGAGSTKVVPDLAVALPTITDGGRTYTFRLRPGIRYSTGTLVRPADIRRGIERTLIISGREIPGSSLGGIVGATDCVRRPKRCDLSTGIVTDPGSDTVTFHLTAPDPDFLYKLALPLADAVPASTPLKARLPLPATGPYEIADYDIDRCPGSPSRTCKDRTRRGVIRLERNPRFRLWSAAAQPDGFPDRIVQRFGYTGERAVRAVVRGTADITADGPAQTWPPALTTMLRTRYSSRLYHVPGNGTVAVWLNTKLPPFDDRRVRRALNYAVDRDHLIELAGGPDVAEVGCGVLPPNTDGYRRYCPYTLHSNAAGTYAGPDLAKARRLVAASGTTGQAVTVWFYDFPIGHRNGAHLVSVLRSLGYEARLRTVPLGAEIWSPNRQAGVGTWAEDYPSPNTFFSQAFTCRAYAPSRPSENGNTAGFCDRHIDAEIARARVLQTGDPPAASRLWSAIDRRITDQALWVVIRTQLVTDFVSSRVGNYSYCYLSAQSDTTGACLDQLWVR